MLNYKIVQQIFKHLLSARPVLSAEEYRNAAVNFTVMDVKHSGSVQKGLVPVISSCTHCFPAEALPALTLGRHDGVGWGVCGKQWKEISLHSKDPLPTGF